MIASADTTTNSQNSSDICGGFSLGWTVCFASLFIVGLFLNFLYINVSLRVGNARSYNEYLFHCAIAHVVLLAFALPFDLYYRMYGVWIFGTEMCIFYHWLVRALAFAVSSHVVNCVRDAQKPYGFANESSSVGTSWVLSFGMMMIYIFIYVHPRMKLDGQQYKIIERTRACLICEPIPTNLVLMPMWLWSLFIYNVCLPIIAVWFYTSKYSIHPDYDGRGKAAQSTKEEEGIPKENLRSVSTVLSVILLCCLSATQIVDIAHDPDDHRFYPAGDFISSFVPTWLFYSQTVFFPLTYMTYDAKLSDAAKVFLRRLVKRPGRLGEKVYVKGHGENKPLI